MSDIRAAATKNRRKSTKSKEYPRGGIPRGIPLEEKQEAEARGISFDRAHQMLREAGVEGFTSLEPLRRAFHLKTLPGFILGKNRMYFKAEAIFELIGASYAKRGADTVDQALIRHFQESETHNPFTAVEKKVSPTLAKAIQVFTEYHAAKRNPLIIATERIKQKQREVDNPPPEPECISCKRTHAAAQKEHLQINRDLTSGRETLDISEEQMLAEFQDQKCPGCWWWRTDASVKLMRERLGSARKTKPEKASTAI